MENDDLENIELNDDLELEEDTNEEESAIYSGEFHERDSFTHNNIVDEVKKSFIDYSASVIMARAIPDLRDVVRRTVWLGVALMCAAIAIAGKK